MNARTFSIIVGRVKEDVAYIPEVIYDGTPKNVYIVVNTYKRCYSPSELERVAEVFVEAAKKARSLQEEYDVKLKESRDG